MLELRKKGTAIPPNIINELRSAKLMIKISEAEGSRGKHHRRWKSTLETSIPT